MIAAPFMLVHPDHVAPERMLYHSRLSKPLATMCTVEPSTTAAGVPAV